MRAPGDFSWVGLLTGHLERAKRFYGELFGWKAEGGTTADTRSYDVMRLRGEDVALIYEITEWQRALRAPANWATFVSVSDVQATAARAAELGGEVAIPPYDAAGAARIAVITDPGGARLSLWQPLAPLEPRREGRVGTCCWNELATGDVETAAEFYSRLFGWELYREPRGYRIVANLTVAQGGIRQLDGRQASRSQWFPYFRVGSLAETLERCTAAGGAVADSDFHGPVAVLQDSDGATFGVFARLPSIWAFERAQDLCPRDAE